MGCSSCSTTTGGSPSGCKSNGTCGTSGCNKLNVYNWLADMVLPEGQKPFDIVEVRFKGSRKEFFRNVNNLELHVGESVAVEGSPGHDIGEVSMTGELVRFQMKKKNVTETSEEIKLLYRVSRPVDIEKYQEVKALEVTTMHRSRTIAMALGLRMKLSDVEYQGDGKKATFFYTADERVDFRELIRKLADEFKVRVEMRQIGMRQEASRLGGIGSCGRELCCSTWLTDFKIVSTSAARYQNLSLNPLKLAGQCGKLKCCLNYELDSYMDAIKDIPESNIKLLTGKGTLLHRKTDIFKRIMWYALIPEQKDGEDKPFFGAENWLPISVDRVKEIIELNKQGTRPDDTGMIEYEEEEDDTDYKDVVGQDSLTRMDRAKKKKKKKKKGGTSSPLDNKSAAPAAGSNAPAGNQNRNQRSRPEQQQGAQKQASGTEPTQRPQQSNQRPDRQRGPQQNQPRTDQARSEQPARSEQSKPANQPPRQPAQNAPANAPAGNPANPPAPRPASNDQQRPPRQVPGTPQQQAAPAPKPAPQQSAPQQSAPATPPAPKPAPASAPASGAPATPSKRPPRISPGSQTPPSSENNS